uniref:Uncharacterized protein n=1 Tax=Rhizophora mucronata TaxID=61149 RepID=A0A2P2R3M4_RHIMU
MLCLVCPITSLSSNHYLPTAELELLEYYLAFTSNMGRW